MRIEIIPCLQDNYSYLIIDESNNSACIVDPSEAEPIINFLKNKNIKLKYILNTHHHYDHIGGNQELKKKYGSVVVDEGTSERGSEAASVLTTLLRQAASERCAYIRVQCTRDAFTYWNEGKGCV